MTKSWREIKGDGDDVVARYLEPSDLKGVLSKDLVIEPNEVAVIIKSGKIEEIVTKSEKENFGDNLLTRFKNELFGSEHHKVLFIDTSPIDVSGEIANVATKDDVEQKGTFMLRFQADLDSPQNFLNLIKNKEKLTTTDIKEKISKEMDANVFSPYVAKYDVDEFKGSTDVQEDIENAVMVEMRKTFEMVGLNLINLSVRWDINKKEKVARKKKKVGYQEEEKDLGAEVRKKKIERKGDVERKKLEKKQDLNWKDVQYKRTKEKTGKDHEETLKDIENEHELDRRDDKHQQKMTEEQREWNQEKEKLEKLLDMKDKLDEQKMKKEEHSTEMDIKEYQGTKLEGKKVEADVEKTKHRTEAEKAKNDLETYKEAEDRERGHQKDMMEKSSEMMDASKQDLPKTLVQGADETKSSVIDDDSSSEKGLSCPNCGEGVKDGWNNCPKCGEEL